MRLDGADLSILSVVVPVLDGGDVFRRCIVALEPVLAGGGELLVVDDGSRDGSAWAAAESGARVLATPERRSGPARARNLGVEAARRPWVLFVDADCEAGPDTLAVAARTAFSAPPELAAFFGSYDDEPATPGAVGTYKNLMHHRVHQLGREEASTFWAGCGAVRRDRFLAVGGFDPELFPRPSIEDIELGYRLRERGWTIRLVKELQVKHHKDWTLGELVRTDVLDRGVPWTGLLLAGRAPADDLNVDPKGRASVVLAWLAAVLSLASVARPRLGWAALGSLGAWVWLQRDALGFLGRRRGAAFALLAAPLHLLHFLYSGLAFALGALRHLARRRA